MPPGDMIQALRLLENKIHPSCCANGCHVTILPLGGARASTGGLVALQGLWLGEGLTWGYSEAVAGEAAWYVAGCVLNSYDILWCHIWGIRSNLGLAMFGLRGCILYRLYRSEMAISIEMMMVPVSVFGWSIYQPFGCSPAWWVEWSVVEKLKVDGGVKYSNDKRCESSIELNETVGRRQVF